MKKSIVRRAVVLRLLTACATAITSLMAPGVAVAPAHAAPAGFDDVEISYLPESDLITGLAITPDRRLLIANKIGHLYVYSLSANTLNSTPILDLSNSTCTDQERGLEGVAVDPAFSNNGFFYLFHTYNNGASANCLTIGGARNRVMRYTLSGNTVSNPTLVLDNIPSICSVHNGGDLQFGADNLLYVTVGDSGPCNDGYERSRALSTLAGKVLRINTDGSAPASNPWYTRQRRHRLRRDRQQRA